MKNEHTFIDDCKECWREDLWLKILTITSILLIVGSFIVPPLGIIDGSVIAVVGELTGIGALWEFSKAMKRNVNAKVRIKEIELELNGNKPQREDSEE